MPYQWKCITSLQPSGVGSSTPSMEFFSSFTEFWLGLRPASLWPWPTFSCQLRTIGGGGGRFSVLGRYLGLSVTLPPLEIIYCTKRFFLVYHFSRKIFLLHVKYIIWAQAFTGIEVQFQFWKKKLESYKGRI